MQTFDLPLINKPVILALGAESAGNFSVYADRKIYFSEDFGDLLDNKKWRKYNSELNKFLRKNKINPEIILTDLHPLYKTTLLGQKLAKKYRARHIQVQHHLAHIFSAIGENSLNPKSHKLKAKSYGVALDGTGYGLDGNIWGGEVFRLNVTRSTLHAPRIGHLENQTMIGGDLAVKEPARMLIAILARFLPKEKIYALLKKQSFSHGRGKMTRLAKTYNRNQFEVLYNQLQSGFNCQETSSTGRVLDAVSILLGFCQNERNFKHEPTILLEQNSAKPYTDLNPKLKIRNPKQIQSAKTADKIQNYYELDTTYLFKYLFKYLHRNKRRLAATAQLYIAQGLHEIIKIHNTSYKIHSTYLAGGIANNKIISDYLISKGAIINKEIPRGDAGISFGQIIYYLANSRD